MAMGPFSTMSVSRRRGRIKIIMGVNRMPARNRAMEEMAATSVEVSPRRASMQTRLTARPAMKMMSHNSVKAQ